MRFLVGSPFGRRRSDNACGAELGGGTRVPRVRVGQHRAARAELQAMLRAATQRRFDMVVFWALDRLTRDVPKRGGFGKAEMTLNDGAGPARGGRTGSCTPHRRWFRHCGEATTECNENLGGACSIRILYMHTMGFDNTL